MLAYGYGDRHPALGLKVQQAILGLRLAIAAMLPDFNRYRGAQAIGSASDLYVLQPTARHLEGARAGRPRRAAIHLHPRAAVGRGHARPLPAPVEAAARPGPVSLTIGPGWSDGPGMGVAALLRHGVPPTLARRGGVEVAMDLTADPGPWLLRALLATNASRLSIVVPDTHPDLSSWSALTSLIGPKYQLSVRRGYPEPGYALVEAAAVADPGVARLVLERAHGKIGNAWREGLIRSAGAAPLTKNEARAVVASTVRRPELLDASPMSLPRHQLAELLRTSGRRLRMDGRGRWRCRATTALTARLIGWPAAGGRTRRVARQPVPAPQMSARRGCKARV